MKNFTNQEYNYLAKDVVHDAFESNISYRGRIAKERQYAEIIIRKILDINPEEQITLGNENTFAWRQNGRSKKQRPIEPWKWKTGNNR